MKIVKLLFVLMFLGGCVTFPTTNQNLPKEKPTASVGGLPSQQQTPNYIVNKQPAFTPDVPPTDIIIRNKGKKGWNILHMKKGYLNAENRGSAGNWMSAEEWNSLYKNWGSIVNMVSEKQKQAEQNKKRK